MDKMFKNKVAIAVFIAPALLLFTAILLIPVGQSLYYSLCNWDALTQPVFVGFDNFKQLFTKDKTMMIALKNSIFFMIFSAISQQLVGLGLAALLFNLKKGKNFFKNVYYLPTLLSSAALGLLWAFIFNPNMGINQILAYFGIEGPLWLMETTGYKIGRAHV